MAAIANVTRFWSAFVTVLLKCAAALGFAVPSKAPMPAAPRAAATPGGVTTFPSSQPVEPVRDRSLPPTMKQRILAEAHGASPRARNLPGSMADACPTANTAPESPIPSARRRAQALYT
jgi:hypothetical protein